MKKTLKIAGAVLIGGITGYMLHDKIQDAIMVEDIPDAELDDYDDLIDDDFFDNDLEEEPDENKEEENKTSTESNTDEEVEG